METTAQSPETEPGPRRTVSVRCTGLVYEAVGRTGFEFTFPGTTLTDFLEAFFREHEVEDLVLAKGAEDEVASGWATPPEELPGTWNRNPEGERVRRYARVTVNGRFNEHMDGFRTALEDGDRIGLMYPFVYCF